MGQLTELRTEEDAIGMKHEVRSNDETFVEVTVIVAPWLRLQYSYTLNSLTQPILVISHVKQSLSQTFKLHTFYLSYFYFPTLLPFIRYMYHIIFALNIKLGSQNDIDILDS